MLGLRKKICGHVGHRRLCIGNNEHLQNGLIHRFVNVINKWRARNCAARLDLGWAGRHVNGHHGLTVLQHHLACRHILVPRAQDLVHLHTVLHPIGTHIFNYASICSSARRDACLWAGGRAIGHGGHCLRAASLENVCHPRLLRAVEHFLSWLSEDCVPDLFQQI